MFRSLSHLYNVYKEKCLEEFPQKSKSFILSRFTFEKLFKDMNLALYQPKKDRCDVCVGFELGNITEEDHKMHIKLKEEAREEKDKDKKEAKENKCIVYSSDVQAVKLCPFLNASALYYKTKLNIHNFTMYNLASKDVQCFWFDETSAELVTSVFASCVIDTLKTQFAKDPKPIVLWSDGCPPQNKNAVFANALLHFAVANKTTIEQKFLVKGHTRMECDSVHSTIETALKDMPIYLPSQYNEAALKARRIPFPYQSIYLSYSFFKDFSQQNTLIYDSIRPGSRKGDPTVYDIVAIRYKPNRKIETKLNFKSNYEELPRRPRSNNFTSEFFPLYQNKLPIKTSKYNHL
ncbi:uncharacterized protein LOC124362522 isoform X1 [Homalodisca vitripennis]|uniref:uncharacterized protein LOC124362522 isoform X1 n=1 Tax=Homalodisca vitripennis TaxID=197043 RepID=UPI001EEC734A|nr:uncharacterized protein LOC124362522 isoform X1 [Homalodisca vitripennis]XP_046673057.1 uncharacterized protein LOC124362522 isoform X1 [Homalodisca vitripennis]